MGEWWRGEIKTQENKYRKMEKTERQREKEIFSFTDRHDYRKNRHKNQLN